MTSTLSVIILTYNERLHIRRCIENIRPLATEIFVVDCHSTDGTQTIARSLGATVVERDWPGNQAAQMAWALETLPLKGKWILRLDADEYLLPELILEVQERLDGLPKEVTGVVFNRRHIFLGKWVKHGIYPVGILRLWRAGKAYCEQREMDEHMVLTEGTSVTFGNDFVDHNLNNLVWWTQKHLNYAQREVDAYLKGHGVKADDGLAIEVAAKRRKKSGYYRLPLFWRAFAYFLYRYLFRLGFLDGKAGFLWAVLQGFWYRTFVDALLYEDELRQERRETEP